MKILQEYHWNFVWFIARIPVNKMEWDKQGVEWDLKEFILAKN